MKNDRRFTIKCNWCGKKAIIDSSGNNLSDWVQSHPFECPNVQRGET